MFGRMNSCYKPKCFEVHNVKVFIHLSSSTLNSPNRLNHIHLPTLAWQFMYHISAGVVLGSLDCMFVRISMYISSTRSQPEVYFSESSLAESVDTSTHKTVSCKIYGQLPTPRGRQVSRLYWICRHCWRQCTCMHAMSQPSPSSYERGVLLQIALCSSIIYKI